MKAPASAETNGHRPRLLLLYADTAQAVELVRRLPSASYELISCPLSAAHERWLDELRPDLLLLAPPPDGDELLGVCEAVRARTNCPVMVLSGLREELLVTRALATGIDEYLVLPIGDRELAARIEAMLRWMQRTSSLNETRQVGSLVLSAADHSVTRDGRRAYLSPIEFRLLATLASSPGKVLTHQALMSRVWGAEYVDSRHYLHLYIRYLREKLEDDPTNPQLILSEWGVGYRLQLPEQAPRDDPALAASLRSPRHR